ncbi:unnamed protein product [Boreogadus saida]
MNDRQTGPAGGANVITQEHQRERRHVQPGRRRDGSQSDTAAGTLVVPSFGLRTPENTAGGRVFPGIG